MPLRYVVYSLILAVLAPAGAMALGLGDIHLKSALNAPLDAEIDLTASAEEIRGLKVTLASRENFSRYGLDYPAFLDSVTLVPGKSADGHDVLMVRSTSPVTEPFATLLIEATWARGRLVREYTVLLDPPVFTGDKASAAAAVAAPAETAQARSGNVERQAVPPMAAAPPESGGGGPAAGGPATTPGPAAPAAAGAGGTYVVKRGETLSAIAASHYPNSARERALLGIFRANPAAFSGNMNELHAGATLQMPDEAALAAIGPAEAKSEVSSQFRSWLGNRGQLHLVAPTEPATAGTNTAAANESAALQQQVKQLQGQLSESQRMLQLKNAELARLQQQLGAKAGSPAKPVAAPPPAAAPPASKPAPASPVAKAAPETAKPAPPAMPPPVAKPPRHAPASPAVKPAQPEAGGGSMLDWLLSNWYLPLGILVALIGAAYGWRQFRSHREHEFGRNLDRLAGMPAESASTTSRPAETQPMRALATKQDSSFVVEESGAHPAPRIGAAGSAALQASSVAVDDDVSATGAAVPIDQGDPLAEADFHMAYGLYDQAADLVRIAISREPQRRDLQLKLLEVFFVWGNKDQFLQLARELSASRDQAPAGEWEKIVIMGRQIAPDDALFASGGGLSGAASAGVDLNLEGGQNRVDFDLLGEPSVVAETPSDGVDLDLGAALGGQDSTGEVRAPGDTGVDFVLDDPARGIEATGSTREMQQSPTVTLDFAEHSPDSPTVENLAAPDLESPTIRQKLEASSRNLLQGADPTAEVAVVDLGLDLSAGDTGGHGAIGHVEGHEEAAVDASDTGTHDAPDAGSAPTMLAGLDEETRELYAQAQAESHDTAIMPSPSSASGTWLFTDKDLEGPLAAAAATDAPTQLATAIMPASAAGITAQLESLKDHGAGDIDLDLGSLESTGEPGGALDLDVGHGSASGDGEFGATQRLAPEPLNEAEPATMSEVGTKLDLARAYMDMGDPEGARSILEEVLVEGSASQKTEARRLVESLPG
jgi:pilus assembly protein FimV